MVDSWLVAHALPPGMTTTLLHNVNETDEDDELCQLTRNISADLPPSTTTNRTISCGSKNSSGSGTPVRKISAHEFERGGLTRPLVNTVDGAPTFLSPFPIGSEANHTGQIRKRSRNDIQGLNETDLILELVKDICNDLDIKSLCHKILQNVGILTTADR
jgi:dual 3',5'-cyclic-AMP and -GMP phosphodiesterase 11